MSDVTRILQSIDAGDPKAAEELLPLVYDELRRLAAAKMARENPGQTLQATALVHEAWLRLSGSEGQTWDNRRHFFSAAAEAMRRILIESARRRQRLRHGGGQQRVDVQEVELPMEMDDGSLVQVSEALDQLTVRNPLEAQIVKLRFFVGMQNEEIAVALNLSDKTVRRYWTHAKTWLYRAIREGR